jgi:hypothetical protein
MTRSLLRPCLGCGRTVRGRPRCRDCQHTQDQAKNAKRPGFKTYSETQRRACAVAEHRATIGDWCPGVLQLHRPAHPAANLSADHVWEVRREAQRTARWSSAASAATPRGPPSRCVL